MKTHLAIDLGAGSGRVIAARPFGRLPGRARYSASIFAMISSGMSALW